MAKRVFLDLETRSIAESWGIWKEAAHMVISQGLDPLPEANAPAMLACQSVVADQLDMARAILQELAPSTPADQE